jgi:hypothetical protein
MLLNMESVYHIITIRVNKTSWAHVWRLRSCYLRMGYDTLSVTREGLPHTGTARRKRTPDVRDLAWEAYISCWSSFPL